MTGSVHVLAVINVYSYYGANGTNGGRFRQFSQLALVYHRIRTQLCKYLKSKKLCKYFKSKKSISRILFNRYTQIRVMTMNEDTYYEVEKIVDHQVSNNQMLYRIRWKGFHPKYDTWEPAECFLDQQFVRAYMQIHGKKEHTGKLKRAPCSPAQSHLVNGILPVQGTAKVVLTNIPVVVVNGIYCTDLAQVQTADAANANPVTQSTQPVLSGGTDAAGSAEHTSNYVYKNHKKKFVKRQWSVANIINERKNHYGGKEFMVRWLNIKDPSKSFHSWEPENRLDCYGQVMKYHLDIIAAQEKIDIEVH